MTSGTVRPAGEELAVDSSQFRAVAARTADTDAELRFTYLGPTASVAELGSGRVRTQIGLKLRAKDACNLVYAMWRIDPGPELVVQLKRNASQATSAECRNHGYRTVRPLQSVRVSAVAAGSTHVLRASVRGSDLEVWADGALTWEGTLDGDAPDDGPVGLRSDNARFRFSLSATGGATARHPCHTQEAE